MYIALVVKHNSVRGSNTSSSDDLNRTCEYRHLPSMVEIQMAIFNREREREILYC